MKAIGAAVVACSVLAGAARADAPKVYPVLGEYKRVKVGKGDTLFKVARRHDVGVPNLARLNGLRNGRVKPGRSLLLPTLFILPRAPETGVVLNVPEGRVYLFDKGQIKGRHAVTVGSTKTPTPLGKYRLVSRLMNPKWDPPADLVARKHIPDEKVGPGPDNPLGDRWMGWNVKGIGFHSTNAPRSIGRVVSNGCVRLYPEQAHRMFKAVREGMPIYSEYEPVKIGERGGRFYLSVAPDPYGKGLASMSRVKELLRRGGMLELVRPSVLHTVVRGKHAYPYPILGGYERLTANGKPVTAKVAPILASGGWYVPAREAVSALGGSMTPEQGGSVAVTLGGKKLRFRPAQKAATLDGRPIALSAKPARVNGTLVLPVSALRKLDVGVKWDKGKSLALTAP